MRRSRSSWPLHGAYRNVSQFVVAKLNGPRALVATVCCLLVFSLFSLSFFSPYEPSVQSSEWCTETIPLPPKYALNNVRRRCLKMLRFCNTQGGEEFLRENFLLLTESFGRYCSGNQLVTLRPWDYFQPNYPLAQDFYDVRLDELGPERENFWERVNEAGDKLNEDRAVIVFGGELCRMLRSDFSVIRKDFVLVGPFSGGGAINDTEDNWGILSGGDDYFCEDDPTARFTGCKLHKFFEVDCGKLDMQRLVEFLDNKFLRQWFVHQEIFAMRRRKGEAMAAHPKLVSVPLGTRKTGHPGSTSLDVYFDAAVRIIEKRQPREKVILGRHSDFPGYRKIVVKQLNATIPDFDYAWIRGQKLDKYIEENMEYQFVSAPPGWGPDCYRHWEVLLMGVVPVIVASPFGVSTMQAVPSVVVDDYSTVTEEMLQRYQARLVAQDDGRPWSKSGGYLAALEVEWWHDRVRQVAQASEWDASKMGWLPKRLRDLRPSERVHGAVPGLSFKDFVANETEDCCLRNKACPCSCGLCAPWNK